MPNHEYDIVPASLAIKAMRSSGFRGTDNAVAELIDNSIQAGIEAGRKQTDVEVICIERPKNYGQRATKRIDEIFVYDNAGGMSPDLLRSALVFGSGTKLDSSNQKGIGKFGMGLPNASISQCLLVEVYSWQDGKVYKTQLDVPKILSGEQVEVPESVATEIPDYYLSAIKTKHGPSGTLVVWKHLDRATWARHKAFFLNSEFLIGRMYRYFIADRRTKIRFAAYESPGEGIGTLIDEMYVRPNDPMMLMRNTSAPEPFDKDPAFEEYGKPDEIEVRLPGGKRCNVKIRYAVAKQATRLQTDDSRQAAGAKPIGKYVKRNVGVSIVRAERELEMNRTWDDPSDARERWWKVEISFDPDLDDVFGVTNDKQSATNLFRADYEEDADNLDLKPTELMHQLQEAMDPRLPNYQISTQITRRLATLRSHIRKQREGVIAGKRGASGKSDAEARATEATKRRVQETGDKSKADIAYESSSDEEREKSIENAMKDAGVDDNRAKQIAVETVSSGIRYIFSSGKLNSSAIFDLSQEYGEYHIKLNTEHPAHEHLIELLRDEDTGKDTPALIGLKLLLTAWARMEDEATDRELERLQDTRYQWGRLARDFLREVDD